MNQNKPEKITNIRCPVCNAIMDCVSTYGEYHAQSFVLVASDGRQQHGKNSPECKKGPKWTDGWIEEDITNKENPGTPLSEISGRPGHKGYEEFKRISDSWGHP